METKILDQKLGGEDIEEKIEKVAKKESDFLPGLGIDIGTSNIVMARRKKDGTFVNKFHRNMLYKLEESDEAEELLQRGNYAYIKSGSSFFIIGSDSLNLVNAIGKGEILRPMKNGIINPDLKQSSEFLFFIIKAIAGDPLVERETVRFSCPGNPVDAPDLNNVFHKMVLNNFLNKLGYDAKPINEAMAICYDCNPIMKDKDGKDIPLSGICCSAGAGMWNLSLSYKGLSLVEFSCRKSGDYLDEQVEKATGISKNKIIMIKEKELDLDNIDMSNRVHVALSIYMDELLDRMCHYICHEFKEKSSEVDGEIEIIVSGGTSMSHGFCNRLEDAIKRVDMPFKIYQIRHSKTPFYSVANGSCIRAQADWKKINK